jgi:hypothetical protein
MVNLPPVEVSSTAQRRRWLPQQLFNELPEQARFVVEHAVRSLEVA